MAISEYIYCIDALLAFFIRLQVGVSIPICIITSNNAFATVTCMVGVVVTNESNMASNFPEEGNLSGGNADMCCGVAGSSSSGSDDLFEV